MSTPDISPAALLALAKRLRERKDCQRLMHGECSTLSCLKRGGYIGNQPVDYKLAVCNDYETVSILEALAREREGMVLVERQLLKDIYSNAHSGNPE